MILWPSAITVPVVGLTMPQIMPIKRGFAGAVRPEQRKNFTATNVEIDIFKRLKAGGVGFGEILD